MMNRIFTACYTVALQSVKYLSAFLAALLCVSALFFTCYAENMESQKVLTRMDPLLFALPTLLLALAALRLLSKGILKHGTRGKRILLAFVLGWYVAAGLILVLYGKTVPAADAMSVYSAASELAAGNIGVIHPTASYLSYYPQQVGLTAYFELVIRLWKLLPTDLQAYHILKCINILWACIVIVFQYKTVHLLFEDERADIMYLLLSLFHFPFLLYTSFVYGEIPSFALFSAGLWAFFKLLSSPRQRKNLLYASFCIAAFACSVVLRKNTVILIIAVILTASFEFLHLKRKLLLFMAVVCILASILPLPMIQSLYEYRADNKLLSGVPPMSYFAMGMQESSRADGWYNGYNFNTYQSTGMDTEATNSLSREAISERLDYFAQNPAYAFRFYCNKFLSQWCDGTYASRQATLAEFGGRREFFNRLYDGSYSGAFINVCDLLQNIVYLGALSFFIFSIKKKIPSKIQGLPLYLCMIGVIGGFLFHIIWEANARYILPYGLLLLPYTASGLSAFPLPHRRGCRHVS